MNQTIEEKLNTSLEYFSDIQKGNIQKYLEGSCPQYVQSMGVDIIDLIIDGESDFDHEEILCLLISNGFDINKRDLYRSDHNKEIEPIVSLCEFRNYHDIWILIRLGASLDTRYNLINTLIEGHSADDPYLIDKHLVDMVKILLEKGVKNEISSPFTNAYNILTNPKYETPENKKYIEELRKILN